MSLFLDPQDIVILTGRKTKTSQVDALRTMGILFYINACGRPVVPKSAIDGSGTITQLDEQWIPAVLKKRNS
jgi:Domain of unknown function (DUF4224)